MCQNLYHMLFPPEATYLHEIAAVIDTVRYPEIQDLLAEFGAEWIFAGKNVQNPDFWAVLPCVILLKNNEELTFKLLDNFGNRVGIYVRMRPEVDVVSLAAHFSDLCIVKMSQGNHAWMRLYDPGVLNAFWETATPEQKKRLTGKSIETFFCENTAEQNFIELQTIFDEKNEWPSPVLHISDHQLEHMDSFYEHRFISEIAQKLRLEIPCLDSIDAKKLYIATENSVNAAESFGLAEHEHIIEYVKCDAKNNWRLMENKNVNIIMKQNGKDPSS